MKLAILALTFTAVLSACSTASNDAAAASPRPLVIHNPAIFGKSPPIVDDGGVPLANPAPTKDPHSWMTGTGRMVD